MIFADFAIAMMAGSIASEFCRMSEYNVCFSEMRLRWIASHRLLWNRLNEMYPFRNEICDASGFYKSNKCYVASLKCDCDESHHIGVFSKQMWQLKTFVICDCNLFYRIGVFSKQMSNFKVSPICDCDYCITSNFV